LPPFDNKKDFLSQNHIK